MKVPVQWIQDYVGKKMSATEMADLLERSGIEVEEIISSFKLDSNIVVGLVKKVVQHPDADRLRVVDVKLGHKSLRVVCGAPNVADGQHVAVALVGAVLPDGTTIKQTMIRGQKSAGMICSPRELGLGEDHSGILVLSPDTKPGMPLAAALGDGDIIDLTTPANRPDLQSVVGLAREIAAMAGVALKVPEMHAPAPGANTLKVKLESSKVLRYMLQQFEMDASHPTSQSAQQRLQASGSRPINIAVDIANYVMYEWGQPLHAFDADKIKLPIIVRVAKKDEKLVTLDGVERKLSAQDLVIADARGPIALAGVMGGLDSAVTEETRRVLIESATFDAVIIRKTALRHGLRTDASARYERGLPVELAAIGLERAGDIIAAATGGKPESKPYDSLKKVPPARLVTIERVRFERVLGMPVPVVAAKERLQRLGFEVNGDEQLAVSVPWWRPDVSIKEDLVEEVGRSLGYDDLPATLPPWRPQAIQFDRRQAKVWKVKAALRSLGLFEVVTYSFVSSEQLQAVGYETKDHLKLQNPLSVEQEYLRSSLLPSLLWATARNVRYSPDFGMYEISRIFDAPDDRTQLPAEPYHLALMRRSSFGGSREALDLIARELNVPLTVEAAEVVGLHPHRSARIRLHGEMIGVIGEVHPAVAKRQKISGDLSFLELDLDELLAASTAPRHRPISRYPSIDRDIAVVIPDSVSWQDVRQALADYDIKYLSEYRGKDIPDGHRSLALRVNFVSHERTLKDAEAQAGMAQVIDVLKSEFKASLRG